eukprot:352199-Chlamydomonas_euryale.AAC.5
MWQRRHWMRRPRCRERALVFRLHQHCAARARGRRLVQRASAGRAICDGAQFELVRDAQDHARQRLALDDLIAGGDARRRDIPWRVACVDDLSQQIRHPHARAAGVAQALRDGMGWGAAIKEDRRKEAQRTLHAKGQSGCREQRGSV